MKRRNFIALLGSAAAWPLAARAQQAAMPVIGFLDSGSPDMNGDIVVGFRQGLKETGYIEGDNVAIQYRWAENQVHRLAELVSEFVQRRVAVIAAFGGNLGALAAKTGTDTIPIAFLVGEDPVGLGLVASLARPGGNLTGVNFLSTEVAAKRLELLRELLPDATRLAVLVNPANATTTESILRDVMAAAHVLRFQVQVVNANTSREIDVVFETFVRQRPDALFVAPGPFFTARRVQVTQWATRHAVPATYSGRQYVEVGGLMSYGPNVKDGSRQVGIYTGHILKGATAADLPVIQSSKFELVINHQTARMLGVIVPPTLLATADEVIE